MLSLQSTIQNRYHNWLSKDAQHTRGHLLGHPGLLLAPGGKADGVQRESTSGDVGQGYELGQGTSHTDHHSQAYSCVIPIDRLQNWWTGASNSSWQICTGLLSTNNHRELIPKATVQLAGHAIHHQDSSKDNSKCKGGGLCVYVHKDWCNNSQFVYSHYSSALEALSVMCWPVNKQQWATTICITPPGVIKHLIMCTPT